MTRTQRTNIALPALCLLFLTFAGITDSRLTRTGIADGYIATNAAHGGSASAEAVAQAAGEFRIVIANILWLNVLDHYHHQYMAQGGVWARNRDILPLIHIIVTLDPHFVQAYDVGWLILAELNRFDEAADMLNQGIANNKTSWELPYDMAMLHAWYLRDPKGALPYAIDARKATQDSFFQRRLDLFCTTLRSQVATGQRAPVIASAAAPH